MANFVGGSAPAMAAQILEGYILLNKNTLKGFTPGELGLLKQELDKTQRELRAPGGPGDVDRPSLTIGQGADDRVGHGGPDLQVLVVLAGRVHAVRQQD